MLMQEQTQPGSTAEHRRSNTVSGRRTFLKTAATTAASLSAIGIVAPTVEAADDKTKITYAVVPDRGSSKPQYSQLEKTVPSKWHQAVQHATEVHDREQFYDRPDVAATTVRPGTFDGEEPSIRVSRNSTTSASTASISASEKEIPSSVDGVDIEVVELTPNTEKSDSISITSGCGIGDFGDSPPASVRCDASQTGTLGTPLISNGQMYYSTAHHLFDAPVQNSEKLFQGSGDAIGKAVDGDCTDDFVACRPLNGTSPSRDIHGTSYKSWGHYTKSGVQALAASNEEVTMNGSASCETSGQIHGIGVSVSDSSLSCGPHHEQVRWGDSSDFQDMDSGAAVWHHHNDDKVLIVSLAGYSSSPFDLSGGYVFGTSAYHIHNQYGYGW